MCHIDRKNRNGSEFNCQNCGHTDNADLNAAFNIMNRFILGKYGSQYKQDNLRTFFVDLIERFDCVYKNGKNPQNIDI